MWHNFTMMLIFSTCSATVALAAEMDHSQMNHGAAAAAPLDHSKMNMDPAVPLPMLAVPPASGKAREAGFDGTESMEATSADASLAVRCAQASRGLIMLERVVWAQCTGQTAAPDTPTAKPAEHQHH